MNDERTNVGPDSATPAGRRPGLARGTAFKGAALLLAALCLVVAAACWFRGPTPEGGTDTPPSSERSSDDELFAGWGKPLFVVVLSAQQHGYLQPCGCSDPQKGGLERRYNFIESLKKRGWPVVAYDLGDIPQKEGPAKLANVQGLIKYRYSMEALRRMGYSAVSLGEYEAALSLSAAMDEYALNERRPAVLAVNLLGKDKRFEDKDRTDPEWGNSYVGSWQVTQATPNIKVGALGVIGTHDPATVAGLVTRGILPPGIPPSVGDTITDMDKKFQFGPADKAIGAGLAAMAAKKPDFRVLLYQGPVELAKLIPKVNPDFYIILCFREDEPPATEVVVGNTFIIRLGHKGKHVGVVGVFPPKKEGGPFEMKYQMVRMDPQYKTPKGQEKGHPILQLMEKYTKELKDDDYLAKYGKVPHSTQASLKATPVAGINGSAYVGSEACKKCHPNAFAIWAKTDHAKAYSTLAAAKNPSLREFDPECIVCHTIGFPYQTGFTNVVPTPSLKVPTPHLKNVGCESCHGPCEAHVKRPRNAAIHALINPWKKQPGADAKAEEKRLLRIEGMCIGCHDSENDVNWKALAPKWAKIDHPTPPDGEKREDDE
jgi:hypothetical protein